MSREPFLKWAGGKRWLVRSHPHLFPKFSGTYFEPFLGSGAVFFHLQPEKAVLSDKNKALIDTYSVVRDFPHALHSRLAKFQQLHSTRFYYETRSSIPSGKIDQAARFIYLNRTCFNGLYRENRKGEFNVPMGTKTQVQFPEGTLADLSKQLKNADLVPRDFEDTLNKVRQGDFVFVDPPYTVSHNNNGFIKYNDVLFSWEDQKRLADAVRRASKAGAYVLVSNANHNALVELYSGFMTRYALARASILSGKPTGRRGTEEAVFLNYKAEFPLELL